MGCDIHCVVEIKIEPYPGAEKWVALEAPSGWQSSMKTEYGTSWFSPLCLTRNYERFAALAGVRGNGPEARGMPSDISDTTAWLWENGGDHTPSWLPLREAAEIFLRTERSTLERPDLSAKYPCSTYFNVNDDIADKCRLVFWFDS